MTDNPDKKWRENVVEKWLKDILLMDKNSKKSYPTIVAHNFFNILFKEEAFNKARQEIASRFTVEEKQK